MLLSATSTTPATAAACWYWNRYPGIQCDNDAYCYLPLLEETGFMPSRKYADGYEIYDYFRLIADKYSAWSRTHCSIP